MRHCLLCDRPLLAKTSISFIFSLKKIQKSQLCEKCFEGFLSVDQKLQRNHTALYLYNDKGKEFMGQFKMQGDLLLADAFSQQIYEALSSYQKTHHIIPIPPSHQKLKKQGFNHIELLLDQAEITYYRLLTRNKESRFQLIDNAHHQKTKKNKVLIVDDLYTTGYTILQARAIIEEKLAPLYEISSFSLFYEK